MENSNASNLTLHQLIITSLLSGTVASAILGGMFSLMFTGQITKIEEEVRSQRSWKEQSVAELLGPVNIQLNRTKMAFHNTDMGNEVFLSLPDQRDIRSPAIAKLSSLISI